MHKRLHIAVAAHVLWLGCVEPRVTDRQADSAVEPVTSSLDGGTDGRAENVHAYEASRVIGVVRDVDGGPLALEMVLACMPTVCLSGMTDELGRFSFEVEPPATLALKTFERSIGQMRRGALLYPVEVRRHEVLDLGTLQAPDLPEGTPLDAQQSTGQALLAGDGLTLSLVPSHLKPKVGEALDVLAARLIPQSRWPKLEALAGEQLVGVYALHPFGATSSVPVEVRAALTLPEGTALQFRTISDVDGRLSVPVPGRVREGSAVTDPGAGIQQLTWLLVSRERL